MLMPQIPTPRVNSPITDTTSSRRRAIATDIAMRHRRSAGKCRGMPVSWSEIQPMLCRTGRISDERSVTPHLHRRRASERDTSYVAVYLALPEVSSGDLQGAAEILLSLDR